MSKFLTGSICLSDIPKQLIKRVMCQDGTERLYLNVAVMERREPKTFEGRDGKPSRTLTHFISCAPPKDKREEGVNYFIGDLETRGEAIAAPPAAIDIESAPSANISELPF